MRWNIETNPEHDTYEQTTHLAAQAVWYFIEGFSQRKKEKPSQNNPDFKVFMVNHRDMEHALTFYRSLITGRWWMEVPEIKREKQLLVACSQEEYQQACNQEIPEMWWKAFQRVIPESAGCLKVPKGSLRHMLPSGCFRIFMIPELGFE
jgi:hypothetical protein